MTLFGRNGEVLAETLIEKGFGLSFNQISSSDLISHPNSKINVKFFQIIFLIQARTDISLNLNGLYWLCYRNNLPKLTCIEFAKRTMVLVSVFLFFKLQFLFYKFDKFSLVRNSQISDKKDKYLNGHLLNSFSTFLCLKLFARDQTQVS